MKIKYVLTNNEKMKTQESNSNEVLTLNNETIAQPTTDKPAKRKYVRRNVDNKKLAKEKLSATVAKTVEIAPVKSPSVISNETIGVMPISEIVRKFAEGTFDYMYAIELNRKLSITHVHKLTAEIKNLYNIIKDMAVAPVYIVTKTISNKLMHYILDGQHRIKACMDIYEADGTDINVSLILLDGDKIPTQDIVEIISTFNSSSQKWNNMTYVELYAKMKTRGYPQLLKLLQSNERKYHATNLAHLYTGSLNGLSIIKKGGKLDLKNGEIRRAEFDEIVNVMPPDTLRAKTFRAITTLLFLPNYNHKDFIEKFTKFAALKIRTDKFPKTETELFAKMKSMVEAA